MTRPRQRVIASTADCSCPIHGLSSPKVLLCVAIFLVFDVLILAHGQATVGDTLYISRTLGGPTSVNLTSGVTSSFVTASLRPASPKSAPFIPRGIFFRGGATLDVGVNVYLVWYGKWSNSQKSIITDFVNSLGSTNKNNARSVRRWWTITGQYYDAAGKYLSTEVTLKKTVVDSYSHGSYLHSSQTVLNIVFNHILVGNFPLDDKGIYLVLTSADVKVSTFCSTLCGYHATFYETRNPSKLYLFGFVGNPGIQCPKACLANHAPNGDYGVDAMISILGHELTEVATDPTAGAWLDQANRECADKCRNDFGNYIHAGAKSYNVVGKNNRKYFLQEVWNPKSGACTMQP